MNKKRNITDIMIIIWLTLIWGHSLMPAGASSQESGFVTDFIFKLIPAFINTSNMELFVRKAAHFSEFAVLGILLRARTGLLTGTESRQATAGDLPGESHVHDKTAGRFFTAACAGFFAAFIDETIQLFIEGRSGSVVDMWIDLAGVITGCIITTVILKSHAA